MNLSDKELDRLSREAANQHDPGDLVGPRSWDRLEFRLDKELGRLSPSPLRGIRGIRRIPFYYAPAILLLIGASYYFIKHGKGNSAKTEPPGGPPMTLVKPLSPAPNKPNTSTKTLENSQNSTSKPDKELSAEYPAPTPGTATNPNAGATPPASKAPLPAGATASNGVSPNMGVSPAGTSGASSSTVASGTGTSSGTGTHSGTGASNKGANAGIGTTSASPKTGTASGTGTPATTHRPSVVPHTPIIPESTSPTAGSAATAANAAAENPTGRMTTPGENSNGATAASRRAGSRNHRLTGKDLKPADKNQGRNTKPGTHPDEDGYAATEPLANTSKDPGHQTPLNQPSGTITPREAIFSPVQAPQSLARSGGVDDAALRDFATKGARVATPIRLGKKKEASLHVDRPLTFGFSLAPDFASVHSVAGDKPGRSIGLTMDYQVLDGFYISTGLLLTRKNFTANPDNYHVPDDAYRPYSLHKVDLIKGSFDMLEIPLNLRYDFRANSNTVFFISGGASSYLMTSEHSQYYFQFFGRQECQPFDKGMEPQSKNYLFSSINLSMGVETGLSNNLSLLIAPYAKIPTRGMGLGQVQITSVGLNFSLRYSPVLSRKRK